MKRHDDGQRHGPGARTVGLQSISIGLQSGRLYFAGAQPPGGQQVSKVNQSPPPAKQVGSPSVELVTSQQRSTVKAWPQQARLPVRGFSFVPRTGSSSCLPGTWTQYRGGQHHWSSSGLPELRQFAQRRVGATPRAVAATGLCGL